MLSALDVPRAGELSEVSQPASEPDGRSNVGEPSALEVGVYLAPIFYYALLPNYFS